MLGAAVAVGVRHRRADRPGPNALLGRSHNGADRPAAFRRLRGTAHGGRTPAGHQAGFRRRRVLRGLAAQRSVRGHPRRIRPAVRRLAADRRRNVGRPAVHGELSKDGLGYGKWAPSDGSVCTVAGCASRLTAEGRLDGDKRSKTMV